MIADELLRRSIVIARNLLSHPGRNATEEAARQFITDVQAYLVEYAIPPNPQEVPKLKAVEKTRPEPNPKYAEIARRLRERRRAAGQLMPPYDPAVHGPRATPPGVKALFENPPRRMPKGILTDEPYDDDEFFGGSLSRASR